MLVAVALDLVVLGFLKYYAFFADVVGLDFRYSTGLTRPDFFDWPAHAQARTAALQPEVVLFLVGPNDSQPLVTDGLRHEPRTEGFVAAYTHLSDAGAARLAHHLLDVLDDRHALSSR